MSKPRLRYTRKGWSKFLFDFHTGSIVFGTGALVPYVRDGIAWPPVVAYWSEPKPTAAQALAF